VELTLAAPSVGASRSTRTGLVLVVDDDLGIRETVRDIVELEGYRAVLAADGGEALARAAENDPCVILLDMRMPEVDGWEFARRYRAETTKTAPIVVMTAARDAAQWAREVGADGVLSKPFDLRDLLALLDRFCA
jgi:CheY-like chemotaxis protein